MFIVRILVCSDKNMSYVPDYIERQLLKTLYALILSLLDKVMHDTKLNIIGDTVVFSLKAETEGGREINVGQNMIASTTSTSTSGNKASSSITATAIDNSKSYLSSSLEELIRREKCLKDELKVVEIQKNKLLKKI